MPTLKLTHDEVNLLNDMFSTIADLGLFDDYTENEQDSSPDVFDKLWDKVTKLWSHFYWRFIMQIQSNCGAFVIDYYPVKSILTKNLIPDLNLKVVSNYGRTLYKELLNDYACGDDIIKKNDSGVYTITDNTEGLPQFINPREAL